jgi:glycosyltransferase involved in cell wall biosynthesis
MFGKKTAMIYVGCDIRDKNYYLNLERKYTVCKDCSAEYQKKIGCVMEDKFSESGYIQKNIDASFSNPFDAMILQGNFHYLYLLLELDKYKPNYDVNSRIKILHAPSDDGIKGTKYIINSIEILTKFVKNAGLQFDFELIRNKSHNETIEMIKSCDILIDQMTAGWYGLISIEAMALGKTTVCYIDNKLYDYLPDLPIINLNPDNLSDGLLKLIENKNELPKYGRAGREFAEKYHDHIKNSKKILDLTLGRNI